MTVEVSIHGESPKSITDLSTSGTNGAFLFNDRLQLSKTLSTRNMFKNLNAKRL